MALVAATVTCCPGGSIPEVFVENWSCAGAANAVARGMNHAPRPCVQAISVFASRLKFSALTLAFGNPLPSTAQFGLGVAPPHAVQTITVESVPT